MQLPGADVTNFERRKRCESFPIEDTAQREETARNYFNFCCLHEVNEK